MVLLDWKILNPKIHILETKKKFFNTYYYNIKYFCPGGRIILNAPEMDLAKIDAGVARRIAYYKQYNYGGSWVELRQNPKDIKRQQLLDVYNMKRNYSQHIRLRIEEPYITIYSVDESTLYNIAQQDLKDWSKHLMWVTAPKDKKSKNLLDAGAILVKKPTGYKYKFICKDGRCANKNSLCNYLSGLGDQVKITKPVRAMLERDISFLWGAWFYANDPNIAVMLNIIEPNFILNIHEVVVS